MNSDSASPSCRAEIEEGVREATDRIYEEVEVSIDAHLLENYIATVSQIQNTP